MGEVISSIEDIQALTMYGDDNMPGLQGQRRACPGRRSQRVRQVAF
jgi:hypothetical protein